MADPRRQRRLWYIAGTVLVVGFLAYGASAFKSNLTPYVSFADAQVSAKRVQVAGALEPDSTSYVEESQQLSFGLLDDDGNRLPVLYSGVKPGNFEEAIQVVAIGSFQDGAFHADQLLVKCPSKYQGVEESRQYGSQA